ncbi:MAG: hypothetical protein OEY86_03945 [Nitrospira sp.]|nr:hypothetical protein [Nitrospira sp.]
MFGSLVLEISMSLALIYLLLALLCSILNEWVAGHLNLRANNLWDGMRNLLYDSEGTGLARQLYDHALVKNLGRPGKRPSYVPSRTFALALLDLVAPVEGATTTRTLQDIRKKVSEADTNTEVKQVLLTLIDDAGDDLKTARENVERWYDDAMDRVSGWYKRKAQLLIFAWALLVTCAVNADTILIANTLARDTTLRASMVAMAESTAKEAQPKNAKEIAGQLKQMTDEIGLPIGWSRQPQHPQAVPDNTGDWVLKIMGLLLTTGAVSLGAPFWFDVLNKLVNIRSSGKQPAKSQQSEKVQQ